jgi:hypothetical protein
MDSVRTRATATAIPRLPSSVVSALPTTSSPAWLLITRKNMWDRFLREGEWGFHKLSTPQALTMSPGEIGFVYLTLDRFSHGSSLVAVIRVSGRGRFVDSNRRQDDFYPYKVPFDVITNLGFPFPFRDVAPRLTLIGRRGNFGVYLQGRSAIRLTPMDAAAISEELAARASTPSIRKLLLRVQADVSTPQLG